MSDGDPSTDDPWRRESHLRAALENADTWTEAASELNTSIETVQRWARKYGIETDFQDTGGRPPEHDPEEIVAAIAAARGPAVLTHEIETALDINKKAAIRALERLEEQGRVERKQPKGTAIWWLVDDTDE